MVERPDFITTSGRENLRVSDRIGLMHQDLLLVPLNGITSNTRAVSQAIHDLKLTVGRIRSTIELYDRAIERGVPEALLARGADHVLSDTECLILAWRRGGHQEYLRVRREQRMLEVQHR